MLPGPGQRTLAGLSPPSRRWMHWMPRCISPHVSEPSQTILPQGALRERPVGGGQGPPRTGLPIHHPTYPHALRTTPEATVTVPPGWTCRLASVRITGLMSTARKADVGRTFRQSGPPAGGKTTSGSPRKPTPPHIVLTKAWRMPVAIERVRGRASSTAEGGLLPEAAPAHVVQAERLTTAARAGHQR